jgi:hypothetical protein
VPGFDDGAPTLTVLLLGWTGGEQWPIFAGSPEAKDGLSDPLNRWSKRVIDEVAAALDAVVFYPFGGPPWLNFQSWALKTEPVHRSPLGLLIHPKWGLWHSYRGALGWRQHLDIPPVEAAPNPCDHCRERPCLSACPISAFAADRRYDYAVCREYLENVEADCLTRSCAARRACPIAPDRRYSAQQSAFHMRAFTGRPTPMTVKAERSASKEMIRPSDRSDLLPGG